MNYENYFLVEKEFREWFFLLHSVWIAKSSCDYRIIIIEHKTIEGSINFTILAFRLLNSFKLGW